MRKTLFVVGALVLGRLLPLILLALLLVGLVVIVWTAVKEGKQL